ncbi:MAG: putative sugar O-methyltransferase, partial [Planctomycetota bacterium]
FELTVDDLEITKRVMNAFHFALQKENSIATEDLPRNDLWEKIRYRSQAKFIELLLKRDVSQIANILVNALHHPISYGLCWDSKHLSYEEACSENAPKLATLIADRFISLAEAAGVVYVEFPEWGRWGKNIYLNLSEVYEQVEQKTGLSLAIPECFGLYGVQTGKHTIYLMTPSHAYAAWRMHELLNGEQNSRVCEIGGGYGGCAYYAFQRPFRKYIIIDLPVINVLQGFFLMKTCGSDNVHLYGEENEERPVHVLPYWMIEEMPSKSFDLTISQTSLTEIDRKNAELYIKEIARTTQYYFLNINQESGAGVGYKDFQHNIVPALVAEHGGFKRRYRFPWWIRKGHIEELYEIAIN